MSKSKSHIIVLITFFAFNLISIPNIIDIKDSWKFISQIPYHYKTIGAIAPFSKKTAKSIFKSLLPEINSKKGQKLMFLEVGPGSGGLSEYFVKKLDKLNINYQLDLVELNEELYQVLVKKFANNPKVNVYCSDIIDWETSNKYNVIVSTLPFNCTYFTNKIVSNIINKYEKISAQNCCIVCAEYALVGNIYKLFLSEQDKIEYEKKHITLNSFKNRNETKKEVVLANIPPTYLFVSKIVDNQTISDHQI
jgi:phospholipid N-methyltransferase